jgi:alkyldihydroxyacetonephosphate synthase
MRRAGGRSLGAGPARQWYNVRFLQPYARDAMMDHGLIIDTLETATSWSRVDAVREGVVRALRNTLGDHSFVGCHISHLYTDGCSLYFTFVAHADRGRQLERWQAAKRAVHRVLRDERAAVSHQHGVGTMHADLWAAHTDPSLRSAFAAACASIDSKGILNPGKLDASPAAGMRTLNGVQ